jgi:hypothetical protein
MRWRKCYNIENISKILQQMNVNEGKLILSWYPGRFFLKFFYCKVINKTTFGVLKLALYPDSYDWAFVPEPDRTFDVRGSGECH